MRILHIFDDYGTPGERALAGQGSVPTAVYYLAKCMAEKHDVTILERDHGVLLKEEFIDGIRYVRINAERLPRAPYELIKSPSGVLKLLRDGFNVARKINRFLEKEDFDIIHVHFPFASSILVNLRKDIRKKTIYTAHVGEEGKRFALDSSAPLALRLFSPDLYLMKRVAKSVILNEPLKKKLIAKGIPEEKLEVIPNGVNVKDFNVSREEVERVKVKYGLEGITVMFAGTITPRKGVEYLIKAGEILKDEKVLFLIVGNLDLDRSYAEKVMEYARRKGVNAKFTGFISYEDLKALYSACDIFVLPSLEEGFGIALTEALASGKPVIGSNVGGIPMQIKDGWNGFLVEPANEEQLSRKIKYLVENSEERKIMGQNSRKLAEDQFDWSKIAERYLKVYKEVKDETMD
ncbi:MAG: glycosyltransferase family 4 protein [Crenarchaeota archaeon]|nr:glycosyltransferase family 4 protein [Thermoproteota archaeon]